MRRRLAGNGDAAFFGFANQLHALFGGDVADMQPATRFFAQADVSFYLAPLALGADAAMVVGLGVHAIMDVASAEQTVHFAVLYDDAPYGCNALHRLAHQSLVLNTATIVGEAGNKRTQFLNIYKFTLAFLAEGDACIWMNANEAVARNDGCLQGQMLECVRSGIEVGHGEHITIAGTHSRTRAGEDTLLVFKTGLAEVNM